MCFTLTEYTVNLLIAIYDTIHLRYDTIHNTILLVVDNEQPFDHRKKKKTRYTTTVGLVLEINFGDS